MDELGRHSTDEILRDIDFSIVERRLLSHVVMPGKHVKLTAEELFGDSTVNEAFFKEFYTAQRFAIQLETLNQPAEETGQGVVSAPKEKKSKFDRLHKKNPAAPKEKKSKFDRLHKKNPAAPSALLKKLFTAM